VKGFSDLFGDYELIVTNNVNFGTAQVSIKMLSGPHENDIVKIGTFVIFAEDAEDPEDDFPIYAVAGAAVALAVIGSLMYMRSRK